MQAEKALLYAAAREHVCRLFLGSSAVEHSTVNRMVAGSNPARGASIFQMLQDCSALFARAVYASAPHCSNTARQAAPSSCGEYAKGCSQNVIFLTPARGRGGLPCGGNQDISNQVGRDRRI